MTFALQYLEANGVEKIDPTLGEKLDPNKHEAVYQVSDPTKEPGTIAAVLKVRHINLKHGLLCLEGRLARVISFIMPLSCSTYSICTGVCTHTLHGAAMSTMQNQAIECRMPAGSHVPFNLTVPFAVLQKGYSLNGRVLRPAEVGAVRKPTVSA